MSVGRLFCFIILDVDCLICFCRMSSSFLARSSGGTIPPPASAAAAPLTHRTATARRRLALTERVRLETGPSAARGTG